MEGIQTCLLVSPTRGRNAVNVIWTCKTHLDVELPQIQEEQPYTIIVLVVVKKDELDYQRSARASALDNLLLSPRSVLAATVS